MKFFLLPLTSLRYARSKRIPVCACSKHIPAPVCVAAGGDSVAEESGSGIITAPNSPNEPPYPFGAVIARAGADCVVCGRSPRPHNYSARACAITDCVNQGGGGGLGSEAT